VIPGLLGFLLQLKYGRRDVVCCDNILLVSYGRLDDGRVESVRDQANDQVVFCNFSIESLFVCDIEGDGLGVLDSFRGLFVLSRILQAELCVSDSHGKH
jgi:hypothetical protein